MLSLDVRQHSTRHGRALDEIFRWAGVSDRYLKLTPNERFALLDAELAQTRPLLPAHLPFSPETREIVQTFRTIAAVLEQQCGDAIETYMISGATEPAHLLEVLLLAREARLFRPAEGISRLNIVPVLESIEPLQCAVPIVQRLLSHDGLSAPPGAARQFTGSHARLFRQRQGGRLLAVVVGDLSGPSRPGRADAPHRRDDADFSRPRRARSVAAAARPTRLSWPRPPARSTVGSASPSRAK